MVSVSVPVSIWGYSESRSRSRSRFRDILSLGLGPGLGLEAFNVPVSSRSLKNWSRQCLVCIVVYIFFGKVTFAKKSSYLINPLFLCMGLPLLIPPEINAGLHIYIERK